MADSDIRVADRGTRAAVVDTQVAGSGIRVVAGIQIPGAGIHTPVEGHSQGREEGRRVGVPEVAETE